MKKKHPVIRPICRRSHAILCGLALIASGALGALGQSIGVHFVSAGGTGANSSSPDALAPTDSAGAPGYVQTNWNNLGASGDSAGNNSSIVVLTDSTGTATPLSIMWASAGVGSTGTGSGLGTPDGKLMDGFLTSYNPGAATPLGNSVYYNSPNNNPLAYVGGLNTWCQAQGAVGYNVVLYTTGDSYYEPAMGYLESVTGSPFAFSMVEGSALTPPLYEVDTATYSGTYVHVTSTNSSSPNYGGNYMVFYGLTNDAVLIRLQTTGYGAGLNGFQIVPVFAALSSVGVHFVNAGGTGANSSSPDALLPTDPAGAPGYVQTNWNNLGASGDSAGYNSPSVVLTDSTGTATPLSIMWASAGVGSTGTGSDLGTPDGKLMDGYLDTYSPGVATTLTSGAVYYNPANDNPLACVGGLNAWCQANGAAGYNVVLYTTGNAYYETAEGFLESVTGNPFSYNMVEGSVLRPPLFDVVTADYSGTYVDVTGTSSGPPGYAATYGGNYMVFYGLTNDAVLIRLQSLGYGAGLNGFQIVPVTQITPVVAPVVTLGSTNNGSSLILTWSAGTLQTATNLLGPWTRIYTPSPVTASMTNAMQFYRVQVQ